MKRHPTRCYGAGDLHFVTFRCYRRHPRLSSAGLTEIPTLRRSGGRVGQPQWLLTKGKRGPAPNVLARDIRDIRRIVGSKYNQGLHELIQYYR